MDSIIGMRQKRDELVYSINKLINEFEKTTHYKIKDIKVERKDHESQHRPTENRLYTVIIPINIHL